MIEALDFGPHAGFVWSCYGLSLLVLAGLAADTMVKARRARERLRQAETGSTDSRDL